jgi:hypothetical protein
MQSASPLADLINASTLRRFGQSALPDSPVRPARRRPTSRPTRRAYAAVVRRVRPGRRAA